MEDSSMGSFFSDNGQDQYLAKKTSRLEKVISSVALQIDKEVCELVEITLKEGRKWEHIN